MRGNGDRGEGGHPGDGWDLSAAHGEGDFSADVSTLGGGAVDAGDGFAAGEGGGSPGRRGNDRGRSQHDHRRENARLNAQEARREALVLSSKPTSAWLALTSRCNLQCKHCPRDPLTAPDDNMTGEHVEALGAVLFPTLEHLALGGNNLSEPLLSPVIDETLEAAVECGVRIAVTTNGTIIKTEHIERLVAAGAEVRLSIEGVGKAYESIRGAKWARIERFMEVFQTARRASPSKGARLMLGFTAFASNLSQLDPVIEFAARYEVDRVHVQHLMPVHSNQRFQLLAYHRLAANEAFDRARRLAAALDVVLELPPLFPLGSMEKAVEGPRPEHRSIQACYYPWSRVNILENGDVVPCCIANTMIMGNLHERSFEEIWNGRPYQRLRATVNSARPIGVCANCSMRSGNENDSDALLNLLESPGVPGLFKQRVKEFLMRHHREDLLKRLIAGRSRMGRLRARVGL